MNWRLPTGMSLEKLTSSSRFESWEEDPSGFAIIKRLTNDWDEEIVKNLWVKRWNFGSLAMVFFLCEEEEEETVKISVEIERERWNPYFIVVWSWQMSTSHVDNFWNNKNGNSQWLERGPLNYGGDTIKRSMNRFSRWWRHETRFD